MKKNRFATSSCLAFLLASFSLSQAQTTIVDWDFDGLGTKAAPYNSPAPSTGIGTAIVLGMTNDYNDGSSPSVAYADVTSESGASTGTHSYAWRVRGGSAAGGAGTPNGWSTNAPIATQGAEFATSTAGYDDINVTFDLYLTAQSEAGVALLFTTNGGLTWTTNVALSYSGAYPTTAENNTSDPLTIMGPYLELQDSAGKVWYNQITANFSAWPNVNNNPLFAVEIVNAATATSCLNQQGTVYNNNSGNWQFDNVIISGTLSGAEATPPTLNPSPTATVDAPFTVTFTDDPTWRSDITSISVNSSTLPTAAYSVSAGQIVFTPSESSLLQKSGTVNIIVSANNYSADLVSQYIAPGAAKSLGVLQQPQGPTGNGGTLVAQPELVIYDQYANISTNCSGIYTAAPSAGWSFGPDSGISLPLTNGEVAFTNLSATSSAAVSGATITFTVSGATGLSALPYTTTNTVAFNIPAPYTGGFTTGNLAVEQEDVASDNSTFSILELSPTNSNQSTPVHTYPVPATGTNALRQSSSGSTGTLALSEDGTLLCFTAALCGDSTVPDITAINPRGCGTFNAEGQYVLQTTYVGFGGSVENQARSATTIDDVTFWMGDKGGIYTNNETTNDPYIGYTLNNGVNVRSLKAYNGIVYALQQEGGTDPTASVMAEVPQPADNAQYLTELVGFPIDGSVLDFYAIASGANGTNIDTIYYIDGTNNTSGSIFKYTNSFTVNADDEQVWASTGNNWPTPDGGDGLCVATNANGGFDLYYTTGKGGTTGNKVVHVYDSGTWNQPINLTQTNILYTCPAQATLKGIAFAPLPVIGRLSNVTYNESGLGFSFNSPAVNVTGASFTVWSTTNIALPFNQWKNLGHPTQSGNTYSFTDSSAAASPQTFYRVSNP